MLVALSPSGLWVVVRVAPYSACAIVTIALRWAFLLIVQPLPLVSPIWVSMSIILKSMAGDSPQPLKVVSYEY